MRARDVEIRDICCVIDALQGAHADNTDQQFSIQNKIDRKIGDAAAVS